MRDQSSPCRSATGRGVICFMLRAGRLSAVRPDGVDANELWPAMRATLHASGLTMCHDGDRATGWRVLLRQLRHDPAGHSLVT